MTRFTLRFKKTKQKKELHFNGTTFTTYRFMCHPLYLRLQNRSLWPFSCLYLSQDEIRKKERTTFFSSIAILCQHVFKPNVGDVYFSLSLLRAADELYASSVGVDAAPAATGGRCGAVSHLHTLSCNLAQQKVVWGRVQVGYVETNTGQVCMPLS